MSAATATGFGVGSAAATTTFAGAILPEEGVGLVVEVSVSAAVAARGASRHAASTENVFSRRCSDEMLGASASTVKTSWSSLQTNIRVVAQMVDLVTRRDGSFEEDVHQLVDVSGFAFEADPRVPRDRVDGSRPEPAVARGVQAIKEPLDPLHGGDCSEGFVS